MAATPFQLKENQGDVYEAVKYCFHDAANTEPDDVSLSKKKERFGRQREYRGRTLGLFEEELIGFGFDLFGRFVVVAAWNFLSSGERDEKTPPSIPPDHRSRAAPFARTQRALLKRLETIRRVTHAAEERSRSDQERFFADLVQTMTHRTALERCKFVPVMLPRKVFDGMALETNARTPELSRLARNQREAFFLPFRIVGSSQVEIGLFLNPGKMTVDAFRGIIDFGMRKKTRVIIFRPAAFLQNGGSRLFLKETDLIDHFGAEEIAEINEKTDPDEQDRNLIGSPTGRFRDRSIRRNK